MVFRYSWLDVLKWLPGSLRPMRFALSLGLAGWCLGIAAIWDAVSPAAFPIIEFGLVDRAAVSADPLSGWATAGVCALFAAMCVVWWVGFCWLKLWLMRSAVIRLCSFNAQAVIPAFPYSLRFTPSLALTPLVAALPGGVLALPLSLAAALISASLYFAGVTNDFWPLFLAISLAAVAFMLALWFLTLPLTFAAMALHGGDGWEAQNRGLVWGLRGVFTYAPLSILEHAIVALSLMLVPDVLALGLLPCLGYLALIFAFWTTADVLVAILTRHRVDNSPISEHFRPTYRFSHVISEQERALADSKA